MVRKPRTILLPAGSLLAADTAASPALASEKPPPPIQLARAPSLVGAALLSGVGAVPGPSPAGVANGHIRPLAVRNPGGGETRTLISGTVPPWRSVLPHRESTIVSGFTPGNTTAINDTGQITASGYNSIGQEHAFLLTPAKTTGGMMSHPNRQAVRAAGVLAAAAVLATGLAAGSAGRALAGPGAAASQTTSFQSLGQMPGAAMGTDVSGISGDGSTIAGYGWICSTFAANGSCWSSSEVQAFRWTPAGGYQLLGSPGGSGFFGSGAVSYDGSVIVGEHPQPNQFAAFRWTAATGMAGLPMNIADAVTPDGAMVAGGDNWWKTTGQTGTFGPFRGFQDQTQAQGLAGTASAPVAVGAAIKGSDTSGPTFHAFRWTPAAGLQDLGLTTGDESIAIAISADAKVVVGEARDASGFWRAFRWTAATGMTDLGTLGGPESGAFAVNGDGSVIVGSSLTSGSTGSSHPFRWTAKTGMQDLTTLVNAPQRLILQSAIGVSADGTVITGNGFNLRLGADEPWRAVLPLP